MILDLLYDDFDRPNDIVVIFHVKQVFKHGAAWPARSIGARDLPCRPRRPATLHYMARAAGALLIRPVGQGVLVKPCRVSALSGLTRSAFGGDGPSATHEGREPSQSRMRTPAIARKIENTRFSTSTGNAWEMRAPTGVKARLQAEMPSHAGRYT
jgi:hypothetical protein